MVHNLRTMNFQELNVFVEVAKHRGITAAAENLGLAKSAVSTQISRLEERLNVKLLERNSRKVSLTKEGELLLPRIESILAEGEHLLELAEAGTLQVQGTVRISTTPAFGNVLASILTPKVLSLYPNVKLIYRLAYELDDLQDPSFDFAIRIGGIGDDNLVAKHLGTFRRTLVASPAYLQTTRLVSPKDLQKSNCIAFSASHTDSHWNLVHRTKNKSIEVQATGNVAVQDFTGVCQLALNDVGVAYLPYFISRPYLASGELVEVLPDWQLAPAPIIMAHRFGVHKIARVSSVMALCQEVIGEFVEQDSSSN